MEGGVRQRLHAEQNPPVVDEVRDPATEEVEGHVLMGGRRLLVYGLVVTVILVALYLVLPKLAGLEDSLRRIEEADPVWMAIALGFNALSLGAFSSRLFGARSALG